VGAGLVLGQEGFVLAAGLALLGVDDPERAGLVASAAGELEGFGGVEDDDAGSAADGLLVAEHVVVVAGDEGVVAGHAVDGEVLDVGDLVAVAGQQRRVVLVQPPALEPLGQE
jgi:hypothetical protein